MPIPAELRAQSCLYRRAADIETALAIKRRLTSHALALDHLAEKIERQDAAREESAA